MSSTQLQDHVNGSTGNNVVTFQSLVIAQLFPAMNQSNLIHLNSLLFLQGLFDGQDLILRFKVIRLFPSSQSFDENLNEEQPE